MAGIGNAFVSVWNVVKQVAGFIGMGFAVAFGAIISGINVVIGAFAALYSAIGAVIALIRVFFAFVTGGDVAGGVGSFFDSVKSGVSAFAGIMTAGSRGLGSMLDLVAGIQNLNVEIDTFGKEAPPAFSDGGEGLEHVAEAAGGKGGAAEAVNKLNEEFNNCGN